MAASPDAQIQLSYALHQARRLRELAQTCRDVAQRLHVRPDWERVLEMAHQHDAETDQPEAAVAPENPAPVPPAATG